jgi:hypothetical protein
VPSPAPVLDLVELAKERLVAAVPSPRGVQAVPFAEALLGFEEHLTSAGNEMDASQGSAQSDAWRAAREGIAESLRRAERLRLEAPPLDYEGLVSAIADLMDPLEALAGMEHVPGPG